RATMPAASAMRVRATRVARRLPRRAARPPAMGMATIEPIAPQARARPSSPSESPTWSRTAGMRAAHEPQMRPVREKTAVAAPRAGGGAARSRGSRPGARGGAAGGALAGGGGARGADAPDPRHDVRPGAAELGGGGQAHDAPGALDHGAHDERLLAVAQGDP